MHGIPPEYVDEVERRSLCLTIDVELKEYKVDMIAYTGHPMLQSFSE